MHLRRHALRRRLARAAMLLGMVAWMLGLSAKQVHRVQVMHVVCAEHGDVLEIGEATDPPADRLAWTAPDTEHDHDCLLDAVASQSLPSLGVLALPLPPEARKLERHQARANGIRGPPLAYAPKTSPPSPTC